MRMNEALETLCKLFGPNELLVSTNGCISRELYTAGHSGNNFYMLGSMGQAASIALGVALSRPNRRVVALDGDGSLLMNMGILATVREFRPRNFMHVVLDNGVYNTTGQQPTAAAVVGLASVAKAVGYRNAVTVKTATQLRRTARRMLSAKGPVMLVVKVEAGKNPDLVRIPLTPVQIKRRFRKAAAANVSIAGKDSRAKRKRRRRSTS